MIPDNPSEPPLQAELQLAQAARFAAIVAHLPVQLVQQRQPGLHLVVLLLAHHKAQPPLVRHPQRGAKGIHLIVLAPQPDHQHRAGVGMARHVLQHDAGVGMILPQLRAAERMAEQMHAVDPIRLRLLQKRCWIWRAMPLTQPTVGTIHSSLRIPTPPPARRYSCTRDPPPAAATPELRLVTVAVQIAQVGFGVLRMNMLPGPDSHERMADRLAIFDDVFALVDRAERKLVPARHRLRQLDDRAFQLNAFLRQPDRAAPPPRYPARESLSYFA